MGESRRGGCARLEKPVREVTEIDRSACDTRRPSATGASGSLYFGSKGAYLATRGADDVLTRHAGGSPQRGEGGVKTVSRRSWSLGHTWMRLLGSVGPSFFSLPSPMRPGLKMPLTKACFWPTNTGRRGSSAPDATARGRRRRFPPPYATAATRTSLNPRQPYWASPIRIAPT